MGDIGEALREGFEMIFEELGHTIIVHENFNTPEATSYEVKGMEDRERKNSRPVIFQFLDPLDIHVGSVLQVKGGRDYWRVTDTEDIVKDGTFIKFEARVEKINLSGQPTRPSVRGGNTFNLHGAQSRVNIQSQDSSVNISHQVTENLFADMRQVIQTHIQNEDERTQILNKLGELEVAKGTGGFTQKYQEFIATAANHVSLLVPFIPALTQMLGG
jgi:hypothetical protein